MIYILHPPDFDLAAAGLTCVGKDLLFPVNLLSAVEDNDVRF